MLICKMLENLSKKEQINVVADYLESQGIKPTISKSSRGLKSAYFVGENTVFAVVHQPSSNDVEFVLLGRDFYDTYLAEGKGGTITLVRKDMEKRKDYYKVMLSYKGVKTALHRKVLEFAGYDLTDMQVDHVTRNIMINTVDFLRLCTGSENVQNRVNSNNKSEAIDGDILATDYLRDFSYNPVLDFTDTWYALVLYKMLGLSSKELCDYNRDYMNRHNRLAA